ncbi:MAG TPA: hypothetical protein VMU40_19405 [Steroidobacteraceae bacterium]|nr:hypothetical protein [Steroidobacteraceae bacterium]
MNSAKSGSSLPAPVHHLLESAVFTEFATVSAAGTPIDTPAFAFCDAAGGSVNVATGLAYPAKAERARRNPRVGLLMEGVPGEPVVAIAAHAAVRDANIQANVDRYIAETIAYLAAYSAGNPWPVARQSVWYWSRIFICCLPLRILWWPNAAAMEEPAHEWQAPRDTVYALSDPAPKAASSPSPRWPSRPWQERVTEALALGLPHLTALDAEGYPLPVRARKVEPMEGGFLIEVPAGARWATRGPASLCFLGTITFIGYIEPHAGATAFVVGRVLPTLPTVADPRELWQPSETTRRVFTTRLTRELERRGLPMPQVPIEPPAPTLGSLRRAERIARLATEAAARQAADSS